MQKQAFGRVARVDPKVRELVERFWEAFNTRDLSLLDGLFADDYVNHAALPGTPPGPEGQVELMQRLWTAFPDARSKSSTSPRTAKPCCVSGR